MVSRKRSSAAKKGWQTRRKNNYLRFGASEKAFEVWDKLIPEKWHSEILEQRERILGPYLANTKIKGNAEAIEAIKERLESPNEALAAFFEACKEIFHLDNQQIKTVLFSPKPKQLRK